MKSYFQKLLNQWYQNHSLIYKIILFLATTSVIVYIFPKSGKFRYTFEKGKPWQYENLYAPFDFFIAKTKEEITNERSKIELQAPLYFDLNDSIYLKVKHNIETTIFDIYKDSLSDRNINSLQQKVKLIIDKIYENGVLQDFIDDDKQRLIVLVKPNSEAQYTELGNLKSISSISTFLSSKQVKDDLQEQNKTIVGVITENLEANLRLNTQRTQIHLEEDWSKINPNRGLVKKGTLIISKEQSVEGHHLDSLVSLANEYENTNLTDKSFVEILIAYSLLVALALLMLLFFLRKYRLEIYQNNTKVTFIIFNMVSVLVLSTFVINYNAAYIYVVPICILPLVLKAFFDARLGLFVHVLTVLLLGFIVSNSFEYIFLQILAGIVTILTISELYKRANIFISVAQITLIYIIAYFAFFMIHEGQIATIRWETFGQFVLCGLATLFVQPLIYIYEKLFGLISDVSLLELSDTNSKLLKELSNKAPGTFHHSLNVANLAEAAASEIGANTMLVRVGALYHDIGKMENPTFFTENQQSGINPHAEIQAEESAAIIINHVIKGIEIAKKNNLPERVVDFIRTHHGSSLVYFFYMKAKALDENVDENIFRYPGPIPFSKETAILMMCDSLEAASKSLKEPNTLKLNEFVENIIDKQMKDGQFLNANITFKEIQLIKKVLKQKLANIYHLRVAYPE